MREYGSNINLPSLDNLFSSEQERQDAKLEKIQILPLTELHPFRNHPFQVRDDDEMDKMVDSVKEYGVMTPAIVRPRQDGGYEIVAGHRRCHASQRAGVETMPCIVRDMDDDAAIGRTVLPTTPTSPMPALRAWVSAVGFAPPPRASIPTGLLPSTKTPTCFHTQIMI